MTAGHVIGTAGHVDHGKSALVTALTGIDPDRLAEEKDRGLTIDLGFAWCALPSGREVGFVDVPGHERFVHNMLAGVGGVDCALLVVDAGEGWRPQSAEHLAILDLLGVRAGVVAVTKVDLVDAARLDATVAQVGERLAGTTLEGAEVVTTAAPSGSGLGELRAALDRALDRLPDPPDRERPRLPVDRVFSVRGSGTVLTGTLTGGALAAGMEAEVLPGGQRVRLRSLQSHGAARERALPARRLAVNVAGLAAGAARRGDVLVLPGQWAPTRVADCRLRCLPSAPAPLRARGAYLLYAGAAESAARLRPIDATEVRPGEDALVRLHLERPLVLDAFEPVVLRDSGRDLTVGGGRVLDPYPPERPARGTAARVRRSEELEAREAAGRRGLPQRVLDEREAVPVADLPRLAATGPGAAAAALDAAVTAGHACRSRTLAWSAAAWARARQAALDAVAGHHREQPLAPGLDAPAARRAAATAGHGWPDPAGAEVVEALLADGELVADGPAVRLPGHRVRLDPARQAVRERVEAALAAGGVEALDEGALAALGADAAMLAVLVREGTLVRLAPGRYLGGATVEAAVAALRRAFPAGRPFTVSEARGVLATTRRTAVPLLEHLDRGGHTRRNGDQRRISDREGSSEHSSPPEPSPSGPVAGHSHRRGGAEGGGPGSSAGW